MNTYAGGGGCRGPEGRLMMPQALMPNTSSSQRFVPGGPYPDQTLGPPSVESALSSYGSRNRVRLFDGEELAVNEGILPQFLSTDEAALQLQMLSINNDGAFEGASTCGPDCGPHRSKPGSPVYANSIYSQRFQSTVLSHYPEYHPKGMFYHSSGEIDGIVCASTANSFWSNGHDCFPRFQSTTPNNSTEYKPGGFSLHDSSGAIDWIVCTDSIGPTGHNRTVSPPQTLFCPSLRSLEGRIVDLACDQEWCKALQKIIPQGLDEGEIEILFQEIIEHLPVLMTHQYANYVVQRLVEVCSEQQRCSIIFVLTAGEAPLITGICFDQHGYCFIRMLSLYPMPRTGSLI